MNAYNRETVQSAVQAKQPTQMHFGGYLVGDEGFGVSNTMSAQRSSYDDFS